MKKYLVAGVIALALVLGSANANAAGYTFAKYLSVGSTGADVVALQTFLVDGGFLKMPAGVAMGYFGQLTKAAVAAYQASQALPSTGFVGPLTIAKLNGSAGSMTGGISCPPGFSASTVAGYGSVCVPSTGGSTGSTGGSSSTGEGYLDEFEEMSAISSEEVGEDEEDVEVLGVEMEAVDADQKIERVTVEIDTPTGNDDLEDLITDVSLWLDGKLLGRMDIDDASHDRSTDEYTFRFVGLNGNISEGDVAELTVAVTGVNNLDTGDDGDGWTVTIPANGIRATSPNGVDDTYDSSAIAEAFTVETFASANDLELKVALDNSSPDSSVVNVSTSDDTDGVTLLIFTLEAEGSDITVNDLPITLTATGVTGLASIVNSATLEINGEEFTESVSTTTVAAATITFEDVDITIDDGDEVTVTVTVDINDQEGVFGDGDTIKAEVTATNADYIDAEDESGEDIANADATGTALGDELALYDSGIIVTFVSASETNAVNDGSDDDTGTFIIKYKIEAFDGTIYVATTSVATISSSITDTTLDAPANLYLVEDSGTATVDDLADLITYSTDGGASLTSSVGNLELSDGEYTTITLTVTQTNDSTEDDGLYRMLLKAIGWSASDAATAYNVYDFDLEDYKTDPISLN